MSTIEETTDKEVSGFGWREWLSAIAIAIFILYSLLGLGGFYLGCSEADYIYIAKDGTPQWALTRYNDIHLPMNNRLNRVLFAYPHGYKLGQYMCRSLDVTK